MSSPAEIDSSVLTVAIIGAGQVGQRHAQVFANLGPDVQVVGVADVDEQRAAQVAAACNTRAFSDYRALLESGPDLTVIALPHHLHRPAGLAAAEASRYILMEKPLAPTLEEAQAILESCQQHNVHVAVGFVHRYRTEFQQAHRLITTGQIGSVSLLVDLFGLPGGPHIPSWVWRNHDAGGGILMYSGIHSLDWQCWLADSQVAEVFARTRSNSPDADAEQSLVVTLTFANGCLGTLIGTQPRYKVTPRTRNTEIYGTEACLRIRSGEYLMFSSDSQAYRIDVTHDDPFISQAQDLVTAIRAGQAPWITGQDGLRAQALCLAIYRSAELGRPVVVSDVHHS